MMGKSEEAIELGEIGHSTGQVVLPWLLFLSALGGSGYLYWTMHRPLADEARKKDATIFDLTRMAADTRRELEAAKTAKGQLQATEDQLKQAREELARTAAQRAEDGKLLDQLKKEVGTGGAEVKGAEGQITVTMVDKILFKSGQADLTPAGEQVLRRLGGVLKGAEKLVEVCGHADNLPVESEVRELYPTNWELSTARSTNVVRFLEEQVGMRPRQLKASGFGSARPVASNATAAGRAKNRRIEILLLPDQMKVVKGTFNAELASNDATKQPASTAARPPHPTDRERLKAVAAIHAKQAAAKKPAR
jgi:flagellar motor protein MotB